jgi:shikimate dehydrogenase
MRKFGLIGRKLDHSRSKDYFSSKFNTLKFTDCTYENYQLDELSGLTRLLNNDHLITGLNVTNPYKVEIISYLDAIDDTAAKIGAVNCLKITRTGKSTKLKGFNTDMAAFRETLRPMIRATNGKALVLGTGGAAKAVCHALKELNTEYLLVSRESKAGCITYEEISHEIIAGVQIIVNATPVGIYPDISQYPSLPYQFLGEHHLLYDLIYNPEETLFLKKGRDCGAKTKNGLEMLQLQADLSWRIWNAKP